MDPLIAAIHDQSSFVLDFYKRMREDGDNGEKNGICSALSISMALAMAATGAKGDTLTQMRLVLKFPADDKVGSEFWQQLGSVILADSNSGPALSLVNGVWLEKSLELKHTFKEAITKQFSAQVEPADFKNKAEETRAAINAWVLEKTKGKIEDLLPSDSISGQTKLLIANALYFKGAWLHPFEKSDTTDGTFYLANGQTVQVPMMRSWRKQFIGNHGNFKVLKLPYHSDIRKFSMYVLLPTDRNGLQDMIKSLEGPEVLEQKLTRINKVEVGKFMLPKFKISQLLNVPQVLKKMGVVLPFSSEADFSDMLDDPVTGKGLYISDVFHKAFVEVNEEGTEAAAATAVAITFKSISLTPPEDFVADHPFMFLIREDATGVVLFVGHVNNPAS